VDVKSSGSEVECCTTMLCTCKQKFDLDDLGRSNLTSSTPGARTTPQDPASCPSPLAHLHHAAASTHPATVTLPNILSTFLPETPQIRVATTPVLHTLTPSPILHATPMAVLKSTASPTATLPLFMYLINYTMIQLDAFVLIVALFFALEREHFCRVAQTPDVDKMRCRLSCE
jgi:hypothetical protein